MLELHRVLSMPEYFLGKPFTLQKAFRTSLKLLRKVDNCYAIVKVSPVADFLACFNNFSLLYNFFMLIQGLLRTCPIDTRCSMLKKL